ncbi:MAG: hypothetical protein JNL53_08095 [Cyclobacteriaceae bacterium]|nr:hypothetical protein [Cyclobacteriaceae bacterium]
MNPQIVHPNQESKSGKAPYAAFAKRNASTNDPRAFMQIWMGEGFKPRIFFERIKRFFNRKRYE